MAKKYVKFGHGPANYWEADDKEIKELEERDEDFEVYEDFGSNRAKRLVKARKGKFGF